MGSGIRRWLAGGGKAGPKSTSRSALRFEALEPRALLASDTLPADWNPDGYCAPSESLPTPAALAATSDPLVNGPFLVNSSSSSAANGSALAATVDVALQTFTIDGPNVRIDYSVAGETFAHVRLLIFKRNSFDTLLHQSIAPVDQGEHSVLVSAALLQGIEVGDALYAKVLGVPRSASLTDTSNDQRNFEFTTARMQTVNSLDDSGVDERNATKRTLRELLEVDAAFGWYSQIEFDASLFPSGQALSLGDHTGDGRVDPLTVADDVAIKGPGTHLLTIRGARTNSVFYVESDVTASISRVGISRGYSNGDGGAIQNHGNLTLDTVNVFDSIATGSGGGVYSSGGYLAIVSSHVYGNTAPRGGGIAVQPSGDGVSLLRIHRSTLFSNTAVINPAGGGMGGGLWISGGVSLDVDILNSTVSGNSAMQGAGIAIYGDPDVDIVHATVTNNSASWSGLPTTTTVSAGGIHLGASNVAVHNSIIAGNFSTVGIWQDIFGTVANGSSYNLVRRVEGQTSVGGMQHNVAANIVLDPGIDLGLAPLNNYGGVTLTHLVRFNSPAVNRASASLAAAYGLTTDQMGFPRVKGNAPDMGSYEYQ